jgi:hypothetical protein
MTEATTATASTNGKGKSTPISTGATASSVPAPGIAAIAAAERANCYRSVGPAYVGTGIAGDLSLEIGITTGSGDNQQRSGIGIYLRSDHVAHRYASQLLI